METVSFPLNSSGASLIFWGAVVPQAVFVENNSGRGEATIPKLHQGVGFEKLFKHFPLPPTALLGLEH